MVGACRVSTAVRPSFDPGGASNTAAVRRSRRPPGSWSAATRGPPTAATGSTWRFRPFRSTARTSANPYTDRRRMAGDVDHGDFAPTSSRRAEPAAAPDERNSALSATPPPDLDPAHLDPPRNTERLSREEAGAAPPQQPGQA